MSNKRKDVSSHREDTGHVEKRRWTNRSNIEDDETLSSSYNIPSRVDPTYGQRGAFPGLDTCPGEDDLFYEPASDGLQYLRMVRSEAKTVPNLLVAPLQNRALEGADEGEPYNAYETGYYEDGAYTALPTIGPSLESLRYDEEDDEDIDPQEAYYASLTERFLELRTVLRSVPPASLSDLPQADSSSAAFQAAFLHKATHREWRYQVMHKMPSMRVLATLHQDGVIRGLSRLETFLHQRTLLNDTQSKRTGAWCWGLLGKCRDVSEMGSEEVGVLRMLAKTALRVSKKMRAQKRTDLPMQAAADADDEMEGQEENIQEAARIDEEMEEGEVAEDEDQEHAFMQSDKISDDSVDSFSNKNTSNVLEPRQPKNSCIQPFQVDQTLSVPVIASDDGEKKLSVPEAVEESLVAAKDLLLARLHSARAQLDKHEMNGKAEVNGKEEVNEKEGDQSESDAEGRAFATLDMIVSIVGDFYGQKDLLDARDSWGQ
ncbi:hypothetical protein MMC13_003214 [Lambiella insularis]|nr:hypothetical protein [Lambiella insularis]